MFKRMNKIGFIKTRTEHSTSSHQKKRNFDQSEIVNFRFTYVIMFTAMTSAVMIIARVIQKGTNKFEDVFEHAEVCNKTRAAHMDAIKELDQPKNE